MTALLRDLAYHFRQLLKNPGFTITAVISLALGIGATTAVFSVIFAVLMNPYPYKNADQMVHLRVYDAAGRQNGIGIDGPQLQLIRKSSVVDDAFAEDDWNLTVTGRDLPEDINGVYLTSNAFEYFGVPAALGRGFLPSDAVYGQDPQPVVVLSYKFWQRHFGSDPGIIGHTIQLVRKTYTIVGVSAPRFTWGDGDVYLPLKITQDPTRGYYVGVRLKPGVTHDVANAALQPLLEQFAKETPTHFPNGHFKLHVDGLNDDFVKKIGGTLYLLFAAVAFLLLIGCANVSILLLARGTARAHELAVRAAIGASRRRLIALMLGEALLLSLTGSTLGVLVAYWGVATIADMLPQFQFPHEAAIQLNLPVLLFSVGLALFTGIVFGLWPSLQLSRPDVVRVMQSSTRRIAGGTRGRLTNNIVIACQIALTLVLLAGAGAAMRGFLRLLHTPLGYDPHNIMSVGIPVHDGTYPTWEARSAYFEQLLSKVAAVPGVKMAAIFANATPPSNGWNTGIEIQGKTMKDDQKVRVNFVSPGYFPILRIPLAQGRLWDDTENHHAARVAVINETMARRYFPNGSALGGALKVPEMKNSPPYTLTPVSQDPWIRIIGVIADKRNDGLRNPILPEVFIPFTLAQRMWTQILVRSDGSPLALLHAIGKQVNSVDADQQIQGNVDDLEHWIR